METLETPLDLPLPVDEVLDYSLTYWFAPPPLPPPPPYRGENGPCGYLVIPVSPNECKLVYVINTNLKVRPNYCNYWIEAS